MHLLHRPRANECGACHVLAACPAVVVIRRTHVNEANMPWKRMYTVSGIWCDKPSSAVEKTLLTSICSALALDHRPNHIFPGVKVRV